MQEVLVSKIFNYTSTPTKNVEGQFWFNPSTNVLSRFNGTVWKPITVSSDDVAVLTDGSKVSLTNYLNTQIAALAEGIEAATLETYKEKQGEDKANTIISSSAMEVGGTGDIIIHTNGLDDPGGVFARPGNITISTGKSSGSGGDITLTAGNAVQAVPGSGASLVLNHASQDGNITLSAGKGPETPGNITLESAFSGNLKLNVAKITGSAVDTTISSSSTDSHIPTAKAVKDALDTKQDTLQLYTESITDIEGMPGLKAEQISLGKNNYTQTINIGGGNNYQNINLGGSGGSSGIITIGTTGGYNQIQIGRDNTSTALEINADDVNGTTIDKTELTESSNKLPTSQAVLNELSSKQNKLLYYSETLGDTPSATISANIKLTGTVAEGSSTTASGQCSHAEGTNTEASEYSSHAEGAFTTASGQYSHAEGRHTIASSDASHAEGYYTITSSDYQHAQGKYNIEDVNDKYADIIGNGSSPSARSNAATVSWTGISWSQTDVRAGGTDQDSAVHSLAAKQNATDNTLETTDKTIVGAINEIENKVLDSHLSKLPYGTLYFNQAKLFGSNFAIPNFPFSICATVRIDAWQSDSFAQTIFQCGDYGSTTDPWLSLAYANDATSPRLKLIMLLMIDGAQKTTEINCDVNLSEFLGKTHTIIGIYRAVTAEALNWDIYIDGIKQNITSSLKNAVVSSLSGTRNWAVNTSNYNYSSQPASANPMMLRNLYIFNFDVSAEDAPYSIADYVAGRLIPPALKPSQVSLALENYTIARNATTKLVKDASGNSNDATVTGNVAGDNDQSIKVFVDEIKTQINQSNG